MRECQHETAPAAGERYSLISVVFSRARSARAVGLVLRAPKPVERHLGARFRSMARLLYVFAGLVTAIPVLWALGWAVWGAGVSVTEYLSLLGSLLLVAS